MKDSGNNPESPMSLMERLGVGSMAETTGSENDALASKPTDHEAASFLPTTSADMATEDLVIPGLTIAQRAGSMANGRHAQEATPNKEVTGHSPELINNMRRLLVPLIVKKAEQGLSSSDRRSTTTPDLAQQADAIVTTKVCDDFIRQAIASVKDLKDTGKIPNGDHLAIRDKNIGFSTATRSPYAKFASGHAGEKVPSISEPGGTIKVPNLEGKRESAFFNLFPAQVSLAATQISIPCPKISIRS
ncbi:hypothetical protein EST38_g11904 [Candolleomyces aberdarensis]|uniref:Uncharacterized protein n=1 Tax=Candolleomyces aberdarensis TaxID=2316362 RepID=A0A4Q2D3R5_9AGAR|nr:hypothetical protein EST38_g11904 [Candolleomyces aberdarensis]